MKTLYTLAFCLLGLFFTNPLSAQKVLKKGEQISVPAPKQISMEPEARPSTQTTNAIPFATTRTMMETFIGSTRYDLQTNHTTMNRLSNYGDGKLSAVWTMGFTDPGFADRGTGYNHYDGTAWGDDPSARLEDVRTGWPSLVVTENETELVVAHDFATYELITSRRAVGETEWTQSIIPDNTPDGIVWPQMAMGGGETVHLIAISGLGSIGGQPYNGVDGQILYYRSPDGGATWDITDFTIPGLDSTFYYDIRRADAYKIDARGDVVAVTMQTWWSDVVLFKSNDAGETWTRSTIYDFPFDKYEYDTGYTFDELPDDPNAPDSLAIMCADNAASVLIDNNDQVHVFFGRMYVIDNNLSDGSFQYFPCSSGIAYWNESHGEDSIRIIADVVDYNANDSLDVNCTDFEFGDYIVSLTSFPTAGIDDENNIYFVYSGLTENFFNEEALPGTQHYRHLYAMTSANGGNSWTVPFDLTNEEVIGDPIALEFVEAVFPSMARKVDSHIHLIYQQDFEPGINFVEGDPFIDNNISYIGWDKNNLVLVEATEVSKEVFDLTVFPNPAKDFVRLQINAKDAGSAYIQLYDLIGNKLWQEKRALGTGENQLSLATNAFSPGMYLVECRMGESAIVQKLIIQ